MVFGRMKKRRGRETTTVVEEVLVEDEPTCTFDDDDDPSIERCWDQPGMMKNDTIASNGGAIEGSVFASQPPLVLGMAGVTLLCIVAVVMMLLREQRANKRQQDQSEGEQQQQQQQQQSREVAAPPPPAAIAPKKAQPPGVEEARAAATTTTTTTTSESESRVKELRISLERETKEKQGLSEENRFLKSALEERKATVQMFTSELQSRDEQLANFEQEQVKVKNELYNQIEVLKNELQVQEKLQKQNLNNMDGQCADLANKVEGLMKELANREEQWENFEKEAKAKEVDSAARIESIKKEFASREQTQKATLTAKDKECADLTSKLEAMEKQKKESEAQLQHFGKQREKWNAATAEMKRLLKEKREEIVGLNTRMELFMGELKSREARVESLEQKLVDKNDVTAANLEDLHKALAEQKADHEMWNKRTADISKMLGEREAESRELADKLESITKELKSSSDGVAKLEETIQDREFVMNSNKAKLDKALKDEQAQRSHWTKQHADITRLLQERQEECASLTARVEIFAAELKSREDIVVNLEAKVQDKKGLVVSQLQDMAKDLKGTQTFRDTWSASTKGINNMLEEKKEQIVGLSTRVDLFQLELQKREDRVSKLEGVLKEKEDTTAALLLPYQTKLKAQQEDLNQWTENTTQIKKLLTDRKNECVGLNTRLSLFKQKVTEFETNVKQVSEKYKEKHGSQTVDLLPLRDELQKQRAERDKWNQQTIDIGNLLKSRQDQIPGLTTRVALFQRQTQMHQEQVTALEEKTADLKESFRLKIDPLRKELQVQREGLDAWRTSTENVKNLLAKAKQECVDLTANLKTNVLKLQGCQQEVANLQAKVLSKEDAMVMKEEQHLEQRKVEEQELENWSKKTKDLENLLASKEAQIPGITTRVSLFNTELTKRGTAFSELEAKFKEKGTAFENDISNLQNELKFQREQRDHCLEATLSMNKSMKEVKEPCVGLTTRLALFRRELAMREERVEILSAQVKEKDEAASTILDPIRSQLAQMKEECDTWNESTKGIYQLLKTRKDTIAGTTTRLELFMSELQKKEDAVEAAEAKLKDIRQGLAQVDNLENEIKAQEAQRLKWQESTEENARLLKLKQEQKSKSPDKRLDQDCASLSAKLDLFKGELQRREGKVKELKDKSKYKFQSLVAEKEKVERQIPALKKDRDSWMEKTLGINQTLKDTQAECVGLSTRWDLFKIELEKKKDAVEALEAKLKEKADHHFRMCNPYKTELKTQTDLVAKWVETTQKLDRLLKKKESECVTFTTQLETAIDELSSRKEQVSQLEKRLAATMDRSELEMSDLQERISGSRESLTTWKTSTKNVEKLLDDTRQQCANLKVRLHVFRRQIETQNDRIATLDVAYQEKKKGLQAEVDALKYELRAQQSARDKSVSHTLTINQQIKDKESQCTSISVRLSLFRSELEKREKTVASLESKLEDVEGMSAAQLDPVKAQLQQQREELAKWTQNTKDVQALLKKRDEERVGLATRLQLFQLQLKGIEESVSKLEERVKDREETAASEIAPYKNALEAQQAERDRWTKSTTDIVNLLKDRKTQITGLTVRLQLFRKEVKHRQDLVEKLETELREKEADLNAVNVAPFKKDLAAATQERDQWATMAANLVEMLKKNNAEIGGLTTRLQCFKIELQKREEACNVLAKKCNDEKNLQASQVQVLQSELAMQIEQRDKWRETTADMKKQLEDRQAQCVGLSTRVSLFQREIEGHDATIATLKSKVEENDAAIAEVDDLKKQLKVQRENHDTLNKAMMETDQLLKAKKEQCAGLATRLVVFRQQLKDRIERLNATETRIKEKEELSNAQIESLKIDLQAQKEQRGKWSETTEELKKLLEQKESQCSIISAELELLTTLQSGNA